ncbi:hypothetical protein NHQ30_010408 [Ciborinia camelliae]|nr:hypothetical protein NHQ30_010408 [Ciborinia camelliae]
MSIFPPSSNHDTTENSLSPLTTIPENNKNPEPISYAKPLFSNRLASGSVVLGKKSPVEEKVRGKMKMVGKFRKFITAMDEKAEKFARIEVSSSFSSYSLLSTPPIPAPLFDLAPSISNSNSNSNSEGSGSFDSTSSGNGNSWDNLKDQDQDPWCLSKYLSSPDLSPDQNIHPKSLDLDSRDRNTDTYVFLRSLGRDIVRKYLKDSTLIPEDLHLSSTTTKTRMTKATIKDPVISDWKIPKRKNNNNLSSTSSSSSLTIVAHSHSHHDHHEIERSPSFNDADVSLSKSPHSDLRKLSHFPQEYEPQIFPESHERVLVPDIRKQNKQSGISNTDTLVGHNDEAEAAPVTESTIDKFHSFHENTSNLMIVRRELDLAVADMWNQKDRCEKSRYQSGESREIDHHEEKTTESTRKRWFSWDIEEIDDSINQGMMTLSSFP